MSVSKSTSTLWKNIPKKKRIRPAEHVSDTIRYYIKRIYAITILQTIGMVIRCFSRIKPNRIAIMTNTWRYNCNPKYIYLHLKENAPEYEIVWLIDNREEADSYPDDVPTLCYFSIRGIIYAYTSRFWIDNGVAFSNHFEKKASQVHIQTMHGSLGIKRLDNSVTSRNNSGMLGRMIVRRETVNTDYVITDSLFEESIFRDAFWKDTPMIRLGHARTDILFSQDSNKIAAIRRELKKRYDLPVEKSIFLYAPTHRSWLKGNDLIQRFDEIKAVLEKKFDSRFVIAVRLHPFTRNILFNSAEDEKKQGIYNLSDYPDIQELMLVTSIGVTDYSSWIFDYVVTKRPGFIYATDIEQYIKRVGLAYPLDETPFPIATTESELIRQIETFDRSEYERNVDAFLANKEAVDDGHSCERILHWMSSL